MDNVTIAFIKNYIAKTLAGIGSLNGKNCTIKSTEEVENGISVVFCWTDNDGVEATTEIIVPQGPKGDTGAKGDKGDKGDKGATGATGATGAKGDKGDPFTYADFSSEQIAALKGEKGDKGETGATGATGAKGDKGEKGDTGPKGDKGEAPIDDESASTDTVWSSSKVKSEIDALKAMIEGISQ